MGNIVGISRSMVTATLLASLALAAVLPRTDCPWIAAAGSASARNASVCHCRTASTEVVGVSAVADDSDELSEPLSPAGQGAVATQQTYSNVAAIPCSDSLHLSASLLSQGTRLNC
jgi:hypothetical protein